MRLLGAVYRELQLKLHNSGFLQRIPTEELSVLQTIMERGSQHACEGAERFQSHAAGKISPGTENLSWLRSHKKISASQGHNQNCPVPTAIALTTLL